MDFREGQRFVVLHDVEAYCFVRETSILSEMRSVTVRSGEILVVTFVSRSDSSTVSMRPHRYEALEAEFVDADIRSKGGYSGYHLVIKRVFIDEHCRSLAE